MEKQSIVVHWFRRDLRLQDNHALSLALQSGLPVLPLFIFDHHITEGLSSDDARVGFIGESLQRLDSSLREQGTFLVVEEGDPVEVFQRLLARYHVREVYLNAAYSPYGRARDEKVMGLLTSKGARCVSVNDHLVMAPGTVMKGDGTPYTVFTPFMKRWKSLFHDDLLRPYPVDLSRMQSFEDEAPPPFSGLPKGFRRSSVSVPPFDLSAELLAGYAAMRDRPDIEGTSLAGPHLRFGTLGVREAVRTTQKHSETFLNELIWREFFAHILYHYPRVETESFKGRFDLMPWVNDATQIELWKTGRTGFPIVDAGMRQLVATGWMHNRVRMIAASLLVKDLLVDWRIGEGFFAMHLLDYELASNNGNWQWAAGTGCDAAPFFRIFNPFTQQKRFDPEEKYIRRWIPEYGTAAYPEPMVDHQVARQRALDAYQSTGR